MKRLGLLIVVFTTLFVGGCAPPATETRSPAPTEPTFPTPTPEMVSVPEPGTNEALDAEPSFIPLGDMLTLDPQTVAPGDGAVLLDIAFPEGWHVNLDAPPLTASWTVDGKSVQVAAEDREMEIEDPIFPLRVPATWVEGAAEIEVKWQVFYCNDDQTLCTVDRRTAIAPVTVRADAEGLDVVVAYTVVSPEMD